jgi:hypothetical protein
MKVNWICPDVNDLKEKCLEYSNSVVSKFLTHGRNPESMKKSIYDGKIAEFAVYREFKKIYGDLCTTPEFLEEPDGNYDFSIGFPINKKVSVKRCGSYYERWIFRGRSDWSEDPDKLTVLVQQQGDQYIIKYICEQNWISKNCFYEDLPNMFLKPNYHRIIDAEKIG